MTTIDVNIRILDERLLELPPGYATPGSAGLDLCACINAPMSLAPGQCERISTGIALHLADTGYAGLLLPRSGLGTVRGLVLGNLVGMIDSDYQGPLMVAIWNRSASLQVIRPMERIAQLVIVPVVRAAFHVVDGFEASERGEGGFGSTGS